MAVTTRNSTRGTANPAREVLKVTSRIVRRSVAQRAPARTPALAERVRTLPIQCSIDIAVPLELAYEEWMKLEVLPEGAHRVSNIERRGDSLRGQIRGLRGEIDWEAEIIDDRPCESFAWRSQTGSDCAGLVTFHRLSERLTRIELQLDVVPVGMEEAAELMLRLADRRAEADLRRLKARLETISPDEYPEPLENPDEDNSQANHEEE